MWPHQVHSPAEPSLVGWSGWPCRQGFLSPPCPTPHHSSVSHARPLHMTPPGWQAWEGVSFALDFSLSSVPQENWTGAGDEHISVAHGSDSPIIFKVYVPWKGGDSCDVYTRGQGSWGLLRILPLQVGLLTRPPAAWVSEMMGVHMHQELSESVSPAFSLDHGKCRHPRSHFLPPLCLHFTQMISAWTWSLLFFSSTKLKMKDDGNKLERPNSTVHWCFHFVGYFQAVWFEDFHTYEFSSLRWFCVCVYTCVCSVCVHTCACICMYVCVKCIALCAYVCTCIFVHVCALFVAVCIYMHWVCACVCLLVHACVLCVCVCTCACMHVLLCVFVCALLLCAFMCTVHVCVDGACACPVCTCVLCVCLCVHVYALFLGVFMCTMHVYMHVCVLALHVYVLCVHVHVTSHACVFFLCASMSSVHVYADGACMCPVCTWVCLHVACMCLYTPGWCVTPPTHSLFSPQSAVECSSLLRTLHGLEQEHLRRSLALQQEEDFAKAHRQLAIFQRNELHNIFFTQIKSAISKGELKPEAAKMLLQDYSKIQVMPQMRLPLMEESFSWTVSLNVSSPRVKSRLFFCAGFQWSNPVFLPPLDVEGDFPVSRSNKWWLEAQALDLGSLGPEF